MFHLILREVVARLIAYGNQNGLGGDPANPWVENRTISAEEDEMPPPEASGFPLFYVTVWPGDWKSGELQETNPGLHESFGVNVTVMHKIGNRPKTKRWDVGYSDNNSLQFRIRRIIHALNWYHPLLATLNSSISSTNKFIGPLRWINTESPYRLEDGSFLGLDDANAIQKNMLLVSTIRFGGLELIQCSSDGNTI